jgi:hypothetical protein
MAVAVVSRSQWGARWPIPQGRHVPLSARRFTVTHWPGGTASLDEAANVRNIEAFHVQQQRWACIGYNFLVGRSGRVFEGAGRDTRGIHEASRNTDGFGICLMVSIGEAAPWPMLDATRALYEQLCHQTGRRLTMSWHSAHFATQCPGPSVTQWTRAGMPSGGGPLGDDDMTPDQARQLADIQARLATGLPGTPGNDQPNGFGSLQTLDWRVRDLFGRVERLERTVLDAIRQR